MLFYLAAAIRAHDAVFRARGVDPGSYVVPLPVNLRPKGGEGAIFRTHVSMLWFHVSPEEARDFDGLLDVLKAQRRDAIKSGLVEAGVAAMDYARYAPARIYAHMARRSFRGELCSFFFAWTDQFLPGLDAFLGAPIENAFHAPSVPPSPGSGAILSIRGERLNLTHVYQQGVISRRGAQPAPPPAAGGPAWTASERFDVAVIGGGCAGVAAALAAAGAGARTLLAERSDVLGGNAAQAFVHTICGLYLAAEAGDAVPAHAGFPARFARGLAERGGAGLAGAGGQGLVPADGSAAARGLRARALRGGGGASRCASAPSSWRPPRRRPRARPSPSSCAAPRGPERVRASVAIDASGDAALAALAGARARR